MINKEIIPWKFYQEPVYYTGLVTIAFIGLIILIILGKTIPQSFTIPSTVFGTLFGILTFFLWVTRCPNCKRPFRKTEKLEWKQDLGLKKEPYTYYTKIYKYDDGTTENVEGTEKTIIREKKYDRHFFICKQCNYGNEKEWNEEEGKWLGEEPKSQIIRKKGSSIGFGFDDRESTRKERIPIKSKIKKIVYRRAENSCQLCGDNQSKLHIHHIDKNPANNRVNNLIILCPNCHSKAESLNITALKNSAQKPYRKATTINIYK
ncbi:HNH endonuclease [Candidatus Woesearchaeota archaeon]|nr:HNH endonuclease [Candidatus Woesearchaeota archaeon]